MHGMMIKRLIGHREMKESLFSHRDIAGHRDIAVRRGIAARRVARKPAPVIAAAFAVALAASIALGSCAAWRPGQSVGSASDAAGALAQITPAQGAAAANAGAMQAYAMQLASTVDDPAGGIYVSPSGNDSSATGAIGLPYKSINAALATAKPGDAIILRGGTYREGINVRVRIPDITIKSAKGEWAVIDLTTYDSGHDEDSGVYFDVGSSGGKLLGVEVRGGFYAVCMETKWDWGDPNDRAGASNILIEGCVLRGSRYDVVKIKPNCNDVSIINNEICDSGQAFAGREKNGEDNAEGIDNVNGADMTVRGNYIHDICSNAIYAKGGATDALIEGNRIETAYGGGILIGFDTSPEYFDTKANPKYYENIRGIVRNNLIIDTGWEGIGLYGSMDAQVYNNTLVNVANGGRYHAAIYFGLTYQDWESYAGRPANVNPKIHHNIVSQPASIVRPMIEIRYANELGGMSALDGDPYMGDNCYHIEGKSAQFHDLRPGRALENAGLAAWKAHIGGDEGSVEIDPMLGADYMPTRVECDGMGIAQPLTGAGDGQGPQTPAPAGPPAMGNFKKTKTASKGMFTDVDEDAWYGYNGQRAIANAYEYGLIQGDGAGSFDPEGDVTIAHSVALAAKVHNIYMGGSGVFEQGEPWYQVYVDYAVRNGIIAGGDLFDFGKAATRAEMAYIFAAALPESEFTPQNTINALPDVKKDSVYGESIYMLYGAGVFVGNDAAGTFDPDGYINRAGAAAIISRVVMPETRYAGNVFG